MTEIKIGTPIVYIGKDQSNELNYLNAMDFSTGFVESTDCYRPATPAESAAGHRIDEPVCTCPSGDGSLRWPCPAHPKDGASLHEGEKEAVASSRSDFESTLIHPAHFEFLALLEYNEEFNRYFPKKGAGPLRLNAERTTNISWETWQHQQAVVESATRKLNLSEQLRANQAEKLQGWLEKNQELQKRVEALEKSEFKLAKIRQVIKLNPNLIESELVKKIKKALGADHDSE